AAPGAMRGVCFLAGRGTDGQADARHLALCLAPAGLLAVASSRVATGGRNEAVRKGLSAADSREGAALRPGRGLDGPHLDGAKECRIRADDFRRTPGAAYS